MDWMKSSDAPRDTMNKEVKMVTTLESKETSSPPQSTHLQDGGHRVRPQEDDEELQRELEQGFQGGLTSSYPNVQPHHPWGWVQQEGGLEGKWMDEDETD